MVIHLAMDMSQMSGCDLGLDLEDWPWCLFNIDPLCTGMSNGHSMHERRLTAFLFEVLNSFAISFGTITRKPSLGHISLCVMHVVCSVFSGAEENRTAAHLRDALYQVPPWMQVCLDFTDICSIFVNWRTRVIQPVELNNVRVMYKL